MKKRKAIVLKLIFIFFPLVLALLVSSILLAQPGDSLNVRLIGRSPFGPCFAVAGLGSIAYFGNGGYLEIVDFSNPADPIELGRVLVPGLILKVTVLDKYLYMADDKAVLQIINVSSPKNPQEVSHVDIYDEISDVVVSGNYAYITTKNGLQVIDISDPTTPQLKGSISIGKDGQSVAVSGKYAYVVDMGTGLHVIDISDPTNPQEVSTYGTDVQFLSIALSGNYAYIADYKFGLRIIDISNPMNLKEVGYINMQTTAEVVKLSDNYAYIASGSSGLQVIDVSDPTNPIQAGSIDTEGDAIDVALGDNYAFVADYGGLRVIDINNPKYPQEVGYFATGFAAYDMAFKDNHVYVADGSAGIFVVDISNPASPNLISHFLTTFEAVDVLFVGNYLYVAGQDSGIHVFYASSPEYLEHITALGGYAVSMTINGNFVYVAALAGLRVIDVSTPKNPRQIGYFDMQGYAYNVAISGHYAYVAAVDSGLRIIDITSPTNLQEVGYFDTEDIFAFGVAVSGSYAYVADWEAGLRVIDVSNPENPQEVGNFDTKDASYDVTISGNNAYLADGEAGLRVINVSDPETPQEMGYFDTGHAAVRVMLRDNYVYVADGFDGLYILEYLNLPPMAPTLFQPANNSYINDDTPSLIWIVPSDPEGDKLHFMVELALTSDFSIPISESPFKSEEDTTGFNPTPPLAVGIGTCSYTLQVPLDDQKYYWRISAKDANSYGPVSEVFSFTIDTQPPFTSDCSPAKDSDNVPIDTDIVVHVQDASSGVDQSSIVMKVNDNTVTLNITGSATDYTVTYSPPTDFDYDQTVTVTIDARDNAGNRMITDIYSFHTTTGEMTPNITLEPTYWDYGPVPVGSTVEETFVVSNSGEATLEVSALNIVGPDFERFSIDSLEEETFSVSPGDSQDIVVRFSPIWIGEHTATLQINSNDPDEETVEIDLIGTGEAVTVSSLTKPNEQPGGSEQTAYRLVSIPLDLDDSSIESVLEDDLGSYDINEWRLFDYVDGQYIEYPDVSEFTPGRSLWLILKNGATVDCGSGRLISDKYFPIPLDPGWNPIAIPYNQSIPIENLSLTSGNELQLWYYNGWWDDYVKSLEPWEGYGLLNDGLDPDTLLIYPDFTGYMHKAKNIIPDELLDWWIQIEASCEQAKDPYNILGVSSQASSGWDRLDRGEPPAVGKYVTVYFDHPEWERVIHNYSLDCRPPFTDGETWHFQVSSNMSDKEIELNFAAIETVPKEYDIVLLDYKTMTKQDLRLQRYCKFHSSIEPDAPRLFNLLIGSQNYIEEASTNFQSLPTRFHLSEGYPNPFNAVTNFQLDLPQSDYVSITIYDLLGRKVIELMNDKGLDAGSYQIRWNGKNQSGEQVSSSIYLVLFKIRDSHTVIRKVVLIK